MQLLHGVLNNFNPRPPRGGRLLRRACYHISIGFQSTPPARGATAGSPVQLPDLVFQSTPPARGATPPSRRKNTAHIRISIHAPREGGDYKVVRGGKLYKLFQSTPPARGATLGVAEDYTNKPFQSTPPARGATVSLHHYLIANLLFQSTPPARGAT